MKEGRETQVVVQMDRLNSRLSELEQCISEWRERLKSLLRSDTLNADGDEKLAMEQENLVPLANDINTLASRVNSIRTELYTMLQEMEL